MYSSTRLTLMYRLLCLMSQSIAWKAPFFPDGLQSMFILIACLLNNCKNLFWVVFFAMLTSSPSDRWNVHFPSTISSRQHTYVFRSPGRCTSMARTRSRHSQYLPCSTWITSVHRGGSTVVAKACSRAVHHTTVLFPLKALTYLGLQHAPPLVNMIYSADLPNLDWKLRNLPIF